LEKKGLITRKIDPNNRSKIIIEITAEGEAVAKEENKIALESTVKMLEYLGEHDAKEYVRIIKKLSIMEVSQ
jgi:DNA-binding MarR family transcriptional regulator